MAESGRMRRKWICGVGRGGVRGGGTGEVGRRGRWGNYRDKTDKMWVILRLAEGHTHITSLYTEISFASKCALKRIAYLLFVTPSTFFYL